MYDKEPRPSLGLSPDGGLRKSNNDGSIALIIDHVSKSPEAGESEGALTVVFSCGLCPEKEGVYVTEKQCPKSQQ